MSLYSFWKHILVVALLFGPWSVCIAGDQGDTIRLLDRHTNAPIVDATYEYADQQGVSDHHGVIRLVYVKGATLYLSHITYGTWSLSDRQVVSALQLGVVYRKAKLINVQPVTVIALRAKSSETVTLGIDTQDRLAHDAGSNLNRTPAISSIRKSGGYGFDPVLRGFKYDQLNVVIDGAQSATAACPNRMDPPTSQIAPNMMERVEILKGPHSLRYGNSFGGTINFVSAAHVVSDPDRAFGRLSTNFESNGNIMRTEGMVGTRATAFEIGLYGSYSTGNDIQDGDGKAVPSDFLRGSIGADLRLRPGGNHQITATATRNVARDADFAALPMDLREDDTWLLNLRHNVEVDRDRLESWSSTAYATFVDHRMDNLLKNLDPRMVNAETEAVTRTIGGRTEGVWRLGNGTLYTGTDLRIEQADGTRVREFLMGPNKGKTVSDNAWQDGSITRMGGFAEIHTGFQNARVVFSARIELNDATARNATPEFTGVNVDTKNTRLNTSLSIGGIKNLDGGFSVGMWLGRAQRSGSLTERFINYFPVGIDPYEMLGNPDLRPETNNQLDLTFGYQTLKTSVDVGLFVSVLQDYISSEIRTDLRPRLPNSPGVRQYHNIDEAVMTGFEVAWTQNLLPGLEYHLGAAYTYGQDRMREEPLPEISPLDVRFTLSGAYLNERLRPEATFRHVLRQDRISSTFGETETPSFAVLDVSGTYRISPVLTASIAIQNVFDATHYEHLNRSVRGAQQRPIYARGRSVLFSLSVDLM